MKTTGCVEGKENKELKFFLQFLPFVIITTINLALKGFATILGFGT